MSRTHLHIKGISRKQKTHKNTNKLTHTQLGMHTCAFHCKMHSEGKREKKGNRRVIKRLEWYPHAGGEARVLAMDLFCSRHVQNTRNQRQVSQLQCCAEG